MPCLTKWSNTADFCCPAKLGLGFTAREERLTVKTDRLHSGLTLASENEPTHIHKHCCLVPRRVQNKSRARSRTDVWLATGRELETNVL